MTAESLPVALVLDGSRALLTDGKDLRERDAEQLAAELDPRQRVVWWSARGTADNLVTAGLHLNACWDLAAVHRLLEGGRRDDPAAIVAAASGKPPPPLPDAGLTLLHRDGSERSADEATPAERAVQALQLRSAQEERLRRERNDPRARPTRTPLAVLTAHAESAAALLAVELEQHGLPVSAARMEEKLHELIGPPGTPPQSRDAAVLAKFRGGADLRNPASVKEMLQRNGFDVPDTRSWRLKPLENHPGIAALLAWRKTERIATTYGYSWLRESVRDGRLRGPWEASDGAAGRMTAGAGLHNLPAILRDCVHAEPGHTLIRADLGQIEPRVLAVASGDPRLAEAAQDDDMYAPVARQLKVERPTAKVAVLAAMYGQTSGTAGAALADLDRTYPRAMAFLRDAEQRGRRGDDVITWGGRRVRMGGPSPDNPARGRFARNAVVQGAAAELFKAWAATMRAALPAYDARIVLCLHDELLVHAPEHRAAELVALLQTSLEATARWWAAGSRVRFVAEIATGPSWAAAKS